MDEQNWHGAFYYTLSTIAQTLAAAFGILSTFMLYRFQHAETKIDTHEEDLAERVSAMKATVESEQLVAQLKEGDAATASRAVEEFMDGTAATATAGPASHEARQLRAASEGISFWSVFHRRALRRLRHALLLTVSTIGFCLIQLPLTPLLTRQLPLAATLAAIAVLLALVCLMLYARLILLLLVPEEELESVRTRPSSERSEDSG